MASDKRNEWERVNNAFLNAGVEANVAAYAWATYAAGIASQVHANTVDERRSFAATQADKFLIEEFLPRFRTK